VPDTTPGGQDLLGPREREVLGLIADGLTSAQIADKLHVARGTVTTTVRRLRDKLGVTRRAAMVHTAYRHGHLPAPHPRPVADRISIDTQQHRLLLMLTAGATVPQIAAQTHRPVHKVKDQTQGLRALLGAATVAQLVHNAWEHALLTPDTPLPD
jgi:DNA-binding NarL/FixJ family response regulator